MHLPGNGSTPWLLSSAGRWAEGPVGRGVLSLPTSPPPTSPFPSLFLFSPLSPFSFPSLPPSLPSSHPPLFFLSFFFLVLFFFLFNSFGVVCVTVFFQVLVLSPQPQPQDRLSGGCYPLSRGTACTDPQDKVFWLMPFHNLSVDLTQLIVLLFLLTLTIHQFHCCPRWP